MAVNVMTYKELLYLDHIRTKQLATDKMLPPVKPLVLYNGESAWTATTDISELMREVLGSLFR